MLRVKTSKKGVSFALRKKNPLVSRDIIKGLSIAVGFHVLLFVLFKVANIHEPSELALLTARVEVDLGHPFYLSHAQPKILLAPLHPMRFPSPSSSPPLFHPFRGEVALQEPDFSPLERIPYSPLRGSEEES